MRAALILALLVAGAAGCASADNGATARADGSFPALTSVPRETDAITDPQYWAQVEAEVLAAGREMRANPRSEPAQPQQDPAVFLEDARQDLEQARQSHEPH